MKRRDFFKGLAGATALVVVPKSLVETLPKSTISIDLAAINTESKSVIKEVDTYNKDFTVPQTTGKGLLNFRMYEEGSDKMVAQGCISSIERQCSYPEMEWKSYKDECASYRFSNKWTFKGIIDSIYVNSINMPSLYHFIGTERDTNFMYEWDGYITDMYGILSNEKSEYEMMVELSGEVTINTIE